MDTKRISFTKSEILYLLSTLDAEISFMEEAIEKLGKDNYRTERLASLKRSRKKLEDAFKK